MSRNDDPLLDEVFGALAPIFRAEVRKAYEAGYEAGREAMASEVEYEVRENAADRDLLIESYLSDFRPLGRILAGLGVVAFVLLAGWEVLH